MREEDKLIEEAQRSRAETEKLREEIEGEPEDDQAQEDERRGREP